MRCPRADEMRDLGPTRQQQKAHKLLVEEVQRRIMYAIIEAVHELDDVDDPVVVQAMAGALLEFASSL